MTNELTYCQKKEPRTVILNIVMMYEKGRNNNKCLNKMTEGIATNVSTKQQKE